MGGGCVFFYCIKHFNVRINSDDFELVWFKLDVMTFTIELYTLILVLVAFIQGHMSKRN